MSRTRKRTLVLVIQVQRNSERTYTQSTYPSSINGKRLRNQGLMMMIIISLIRMYAYIVLAGF